MLRISGLRINIERITIPNYTGRVNDEEYGLIVEELCRLLRTDKTAIKNIKVRRKSVDARKGKKIAYIYNVDVKVKRELYSKINKIKNNKNNVNIDIVEEEEKEKFCPYFTCSKQDKGMSFSDHETEKKPVLIAGAGPAGLFCAYILALNGLKPVLIEQGKCMEERIKDVEMFWNDNSALNLYSNVAFGEGGAGTFSDGKLNTTVKDPSGRIEYVKKVFVEHGAPEEIAYLAKPHIGTDELRHVIVSLRQSIIAKGGSVLFGTKLTDIYTEVDESSKSGAAEKNELSNTGLIRSLSGIKVYDIEKNEYKTIDCDKLVLATGHSARDTYSMLKDKVTLEPKDFAIGVRVEHEQEFINRTQYGEYHNMMPAADYKLRYHSENGRAVYSFCMCPGGKVVNASTEKGMSVTNGMSDHSRDSGYANSAIVVNVTREDFDGDDVLAGVEFQRKWEKKAYELSGGGVLEECYGEFADGKLKNALPEYVSEAINEAMNHFDRQMPGFADKSVKMYGVETRTSAPVRILRDESGNSSIRGIYPCGEGAGYAGGIMSAAVDGIRVAQMICKHLQS